MTVTVSVDATWRMSRVEIFEPHSTTGTVDGYGEVLIEQPSGTKTNMPGVTPHGDSSTTLGVMQGSKITRVIGDVLSDTVDVGAGKMVSFSELMEAMRLFMEQWRIEDEETRPESLAPQAVPLTPMPPEWDPPKYDELPPPVTGTVPPPVPPPE
jgi:hypothetical protein